ncbi:ECF transporter S component [Acetobacterium paludosum]|uniref:ECF transporter S component n=1 Tax=Acetobacterium paludosum TaxID=52693 RepID=A0A923HV78_9FIRM|nr:ECF transporter S component [Acetobacterium paludosum]MBC3888287.1 ECF transporter S component [Acetobacterium paludosum]
MKNVKTNDLVKVSFFVAIIVLLAATPFLGYIPLGFTRATIIHIPVIIGSILLGPFYGAFLGFVFGLTSLINNTFNPTVTSFVFTPFYSIGTSSGNFWSLVICFVPRILVGVVPYYLYKGMKKIKNNDVLALSVAGVGGSLTNTLLVMNGIYLFFGQSYAQAKNVGFSTLYGVILTVIGINGVPEAIVAGILTTAICKVLLKYTNRALLS